MYLGPQGTSTAIHADVLRSFSWSTNICGRKVPLLHPHEARLLAFSARHDAFQAGSGVRCTWRCGGWLVLGSFCKDPDYLASASSQPQLQR